jgi:hypothetical protein
LDALNLAMRVAPQSDSHSGSKSLHIVNLFVRASLESLYDEIETFVHKIMPLRVSDSTVLGSASPRWSSISPKKRSREIDEIPVLKPNTFTLQ